MNRFTITPRRLRAALCALGAATLLAACGGGDGLGSGGTGAANETFATGTVDGFGSIYVGGERCDPLGARIAWDTFTGGPEGPANPDVKLGQRLELDLDGASTACRIVAARISPEVIGLVDSVSPLVVAGAPVIVNTDPAAGPVTVFDGYADASEIAVGDRVEVHGKAVSASAGAAIRATRIERKPATDAWIRVAGVISNLTPSSFTLGGLTVNYGSSTTVLPTGFALRDGLTVALWSTGAVYGSNQVDARVVRVLRRQFADAQKVRVQGPVTGCAGARPCSEPVIDGITVQITASTTFTVGSAAEVADGRVLHVRGTFDATSGKLVARTVAVRRAADGVVTLLGSVSDYATDGTTATFRVRGVPVTTTGSTTFGAGCTVDDDKVVSVAGSIVGSAVQATRIDCPAVAVGTVVDAYGSIGALDATAKTFRLEGRPLLSLATLQWDANTVFSNGATPESLANGQYVAVRGVYQGGNRFLLTRVILDQTPPTSPTGGLVFSTVGIAHHITANAMRVNLLSLTVTSASSVAADVVPGATVRVWFYRDVPNARWVVLRARAVVW